MRHSKWILSGLLAGFAILTIGIQAIGCGSYGPPRDRLVLDAISDRTDKSQPALQQLQKLGKQGVQRVMNQKQGTERHLNMINNWIKGTENNLNNNRAKWNKGQIENSVRWLHRLTSQRQSLVNDLVRVEALLNQLSAMDKPNAILAVMPVNVQ